MKTIHILSLLTLLLMTLEEPSAWAQKDDVKKIRQRAEKGLKEAQYNMGVCYANGRGVERDMAQAAAWYALSAEQGFASAQFNLALCYYDGTGVPQERAEAVRLWREMIARGEGGVTPFIELAKHYEHFERDIPRALEMTREALVRAAEPRLTPDAEAEAQLEALEKRYQRLKKKEQAQRKNGADDVPY